MIDLDVKFKREIKNVQVSSFVVYVVGIKNYDLLKMLWPTLFKGALLQWGLAVDDRLNLTPNTTKKRGN